MQRDAWNNYRIQTTLGNIRDAFHKLVLEKNYDVITVSDLCAEAKIGRKTFYMYYFSLDSLLEEILESMTREYVQRIAKYRVPDNIKEITREFYLYSEEKGRFYENLVCSKSYQDIGNKLLNKFVRETWQNEKWFMELGNDLQNIILCFIYNVGSSLYRQWISNGRKVELEQMVLLADLLLSSGINGFLQSCK